jgi:hypothetical protein
MTGAERQRRWRDRDRAGRIVLQVEVEQHRLAAVLADQGAFLSSEDATREELGEAVGRLLEALVTRYERERWPDL